MENFFRCYPTRFDQRIFIGHNEQISKKCHVATVLCGQGRERAMTDFEYNMHIENKQEEIDRPFVSPAVIRRLPRYFRYLRELLREGKTRISSGELSARMQVTASQIRQDLNCFGGFGQQGYGYNVSYLYSKISDLLGVSMGLQAIMVGAGDLGRALVRSTMFEKRGLDIIALFDVDPNLIGKEFGGVQVHDMKELETFCTEHTVDMAVLTLPKEKAEEESTRLLTLGVEGFWNFTGKELSHLPDSVVVENVHLGDSLMSLNYELCRLKSEKDKKRIKE